MTHDLILKNIARHITLTQGEADSFVSLLEYQEIKKKTSLLKAGRPCKLFYYVQSGALRAFHIDTRGKESTIMFAAADWWITDMHCFLNESAAMTHIEAIEDSCLFQLSKNDWDALMVEVPKFERYFRILLQNAYTREQLRMIDNLSLTAEERYTKFLDKYPQIVPHLTQKQIASYLGVTPEFLSFIRKAKTVKTNS